MGLLRMEEKIPATLVLFSLDTVEEEPKAWGLAGEVWTASSRRLLLLICRFREKSAFSLVDVRAASLAASKMQSCETQRGCCLSCCSEKEVMAEATDALSQPKSIITGRSLSVATRFMVLLTCSCSKLADFWASLKIMNRGWRNGEKPRNYKARQKRCHHRSFGIEHGIGVNGHVLSGRNLSVSGFDT